MTPWLRAHPVAGYVLLAFGTSYLVGMPLLMVGSGLLPTRWGLAHTYLPRVGVTYGPAVAALVLAWLTRAPDTPRGLLRAAVPRWRDLPLALAILLAGAVTSAAALLAAGVAHGELFTAVRGTAALSPRISPSSSRSSRSVRRSVGAAGSCPRSRRAPRASARRSASARSGDSGTRPYWCRAPCGEPCSSWARWGCPSCSPRSGRSPAGGRSSPWSRTRP